MMKVITPAAFLFGRNVSIAPPTGTIGSGRSGFAQSQSGRRLRIGGSASKFSCGGGEVVAHSSVHACHGLSPAGFPRTKLLTKSHTKRMDAAVMKNAPMVDTIFIQPQPGRSG